MAYESGDTKQDARTVVYLGNRDAVEVLDDPDDVAAAAEQNRAAAKVRRKLDGKRCTTVVLPSDATLATALVDIAGPRGLWPHMSDAATPAWVASTDPKLAELLSAQWGGIEIRDPDPDHQPTED